MDLQDYYASLHQNLSLYSSSLYTPAPITDFYDHDRAYELRVEAWENQATDKREKQGRQTVRDTVLAFARNETHHLVNKDPESGFVLVDLSNQGLTTFPPIDELSDTVTALDLSGNQITELPAGVFQRLGNLRWLKLSDNQIHCIAPGAFRGLDNIHYLSLANNSLRELPENSLEGLNKQCKLILSYNHFSPLQVQDLLERHQQTEYSGPHLHTVNQMLPSPEEAACCNQERQEYPKWYDSNLPYEQRLEAWAESASASEAEVQNRKTIEEGILAFKVGGKSTIAPQTYLRKWVELDLSDQGLTAIPPLDDLPDTLISLNLKGNKLRVIPVKAFQGLKNLKRIVLDENSIHTIHPNAFQGLEKIQSISVVSNCLKTLPVEVFSTLHHRCLILLDLDLFSHATTQTISSDIASPPFTGATLVGVHSARLTETGNEGLAPPVETESGDGCTDPFFSRDSKNPFQTSSSDPSSLVTEMPPPESEKPEEVPNSDLVENNPVAFPPPITPLAEMEQDDSCNRQLMSEAEEEPNQIVRYEPALVAYEPLTEQARAEAAHDLPLIETDNSKSLTRRWSSLTEARSDDGYNSQVVSDDEDEQDPTTVQHPFPFETGSNDCFSLSWTSRTETMSDDGYNSSALLSDDEEDPSQTVHDKPSLLQHIHLAEQEAQPEVSAGSSILFSDTSAPFLQEQPEPDDSPAREPCLSPEPGSALEDDPLVKATISQISSKKEPGLMDLSCQQLAQLPLLDPLQDRLTMLLLGGNRLESIPSGAFVGLKNLRLLDLSENRLKILPDNTFQPLEKLLKVDLSGNCLEELTEESLFGLSRHCRVLLRRNCFSKDMAQRVQERLVLPEYKGPQLEGFHPCELSQSSNMAYIKEVCAPEDLTQPPEEECSTPLSLETTDATNDSIALLPTRLEDWAEEVDVIKEKLIKKRYVLAACYRPERWHDLTGWCEQGEITIVDWEKLEYRLELDEQKIQEKLGRELAYAELEKEKEPKLKKILQRDLNFIGNTGLYPLILSSDPDITPENGKVFLGTVNAKNPTTRKEETHDIYIEYETLPGLLDTGVAFSQGRRTGRTEDTHIADKFPIQVNGKTEFIEITGVFDGHGGTQWSEYARNRIIAHLQFWLQAFNSHGFSDRNIWNAIKIAFVTLNNTLCKDRPFFGSGTTAVISLKINGDRWVANTGDSRAIEIDSEGNTRVLTEDAEPDNKRHERSVKNRGGDISYWSGCERVNGVLAMTRKLGDDGHAAASSRPKIIKIPKDQLPGKQLLLFCDGFSEVATPNEMGRVASQLLKTYTPAQVAALLTSQGLAADSGDNMTCMITPMA
ncbi:leucine-rich repeat protein [Endozoicomonas elysicola]|uniref:PPM-type phosphatase domain-containing protein n=1 Tax=Endozoicomonas elysicola TaxID=305900 RepID=A0A081KAM2_9GAMM|nr:leucine-rich repeat protein [Endozoicomonas elysicola]KEI71198.1 hypothetical protein GV64_11000 [Endozoicomonas elysicola]